MLGAILTTSLGVTFQGAPVQAAPIEGALVLQASLYFSTFKSLHNKTYPSEAENTARFEVFKENLAYIEAENSKGHPYKLGIGPFTDLTESEFLTLYTGTPNEPQQHGGPLYLGEHQTPVEEEPEEKLDWTTKGAVTPVKNQGSCGSCWSFSSTGVLEGAYAVKTGKLVSLSEQELVDCMMVNASTGIGKGCHGGWPYNAMKFAAAHSMCTEGSYPYTAKDGKCALGAANFTCEAGEAKGVVTGYKSVPKKERGLVSALKAQPVSITVKADKDMQHYKSGVLSIPCNGSQINHAVLAVGYGFALSKGRHVKVKNSWGTTWGDGGYMLMGVRDSVNPSCVYNDAPVYPVLA